MKSRAYLISWALFAGAVHGQVYQWTDEDGRKQFSDTKPPIQSTKDVQEVVISEGNFVDQDQAQRERNREYFDSQQAEREESRQAKKAAAAEEDRFRLISGAANNKADRERQQAEIRDARNNLRHTPHLRAPRAPMAPGVP
ncbi:DUF4124 domain-containing protein [Halopseudomonas sp.]|uniref:DUF4124 domain-containing protein n=1 Tax=Halopseudomonas sp. TaxID=2901191 RepID=UPI0030037D33